MKIFTVRDPYLCNSVDRDAPAQKIVRLLTRHLELIPSDTGFFGAFHFKIGFHAAMKPNAQASSLCCSEKGYGRIKCSKMNPANFESRLCARQPTDLIKLLFTEMQQHFVHNDLSG